MPSFGRDLADLIQQHYPGALKDDRGQMDRLVTDISVTFGGLLAFAYRMGGVDAAGQVIERVMTEMLSAAASIDKRAIEKAKERAHDL